MTESSEQNPHPTRSLKAIEAPLDPANQSLADALRTSFRILKFAMIILVILFLASGTFVVEQSEQAMVLRLGDPVGSVREAGLWWAFPHPIDEVLKLPAKESNRLAIDSHWFHVREQDKGKSLGEITRGRRGLHPTRDGALLTADKGLVHVKWRLTYRIDDLNHYVATVADAQTDKAEKLITRLLENAAIHVAGGFTTEEVTRRRLTDLRDQVKILVNESLERLGTGLYVESVEIPESTPPLQTRLAFDQVIREENKKQSAIREAEQAAADFLNKTAGAAHTLLIALLDELDTAGVAGHAAEIEHLEAEIDRVLRFEAAGEVGSLIGDAKVYFTAAVQEIRGDVEEYEAYLPEYRERPDLLKARLWEEVRQRVFRRPDVIKLIFPPGAETRIRIFPDPRQREIRERREYEEEASEYDHRQLEILYPGGIPE